MMSFFSNVTEAPPIAVFALGDACRRDENSNKVNLGVGAYRTDEGNPWVLPVVRSTECMMSSDLTLNKEYLPVSGLESMCLAGTKIALGDDSTLIATKKADSCQVLGGTGGIYLALLFLKQISGLTTVYVSNPTWQYRYWDAKNRNVDFDGLISDLTNAPESSIIILHACAHNPTGTDLTKEQWERVYHVIKEKKHFPLFDMAYQGFAGGNVDEDAWAVRMFSSKNTELFICQSFSKNFGLYNERVGNLVFISHDPQTTSRIKSQMILLARRIWSNPPQHGARIVSTILNNPSMLNEWKDCVRAMAGRISQMRVGLYDRLKNLGTPGDWTHIKTQIGMFSYSGLTLSQVRHLRDKYHLYIMDDGRINVCAINTHNIDYIAQSIHNTVLSVAGSSA